MTFTTADLAVLYQAIPPPTIGGVRKPMKPGGYSDSGADIAYVLRAAGVKVITPAAIPALDRDLDWVFPDHAAGIVAARAAGANVLWANTILFRGHPLETEAGAAAIVGQPPALVDRFDDKWVTNSLLRARGCPVAESVLISAVHRLEPSGPTGSIALRSGTLQAFRARSADEHSFNLSEANLAKAGLRFPLIVKPVRGRGSEGVQLVGSLPQLISAGQKLLSEHGQTFILEEYLSGDEITVTVMPPGVYAIAGAEVSQVDYWTLPPVLRFNHRDGIAPYSGVVRVVDNSRVLTAHTSAAPAVEAVLAACVRAAEAIGPKAPIRIDCRQAPNGEFRLFDLNLKPNMTGPGRPGRENQDSLTGLAARAIGWSYPDLLQNMLRQARTESR